MDLRVPSGLFFAILGVILVGLGVLAPDMRAPLTDMNINLYSGISMLVFGAFLLFMARRASRKQP
jgi:ABC-type antimicrobial peptide transport system permease subunit